MNNIIRTARRVATASVLAAAVVPFAASTASAAPKTASGKRATYVKPAAAPATTAAATTAAAPKAADAPVTAIHAIGGYVFVNVTYLEAVELYFKAVAAAPAGYTPPAVTSISAQTTVSGTVTDPGAR